ncbi:MAG TPA: hypothetical protein VK668_19670 [Mucilaginibacter sp.]|nr:hypothetical protein [Mucilaginibacter sp.]
MKLKIKVLFALLAGTALIYAGCKKLDDGSPGTVTPKEVSSQVALNIAQTLYNGFGVFSVSDGINGPSGLGLSREKLALKLNHGRKINDLDGDITCGLSIDTTLNETYTGDDGSQFSISGPFSISFTCTNGNPSGIHVFNNLNISESTTQLAATYKLAEDLTLQAVNPQSDQSDISLSGTLGFSDNVTLKTGSKASTAETFNYKYTSIIINTNGDLASGSATFSTKGTNASGTWNYSGTVVFLGNNKVKITINGTVYNVDLQTGVVS